MSTLSVNKLQSTAGLEYGKCLAWVNFNGTGTVAIRKAMNVSSITDNGTGDYTINFTTALPDANYVTVGDCSSTTAARAATLTTNNAASIPTTTSVRLLAIDHSGTPAHTVFDPVYASVIIFD